MTGLSLGDTGKGTRNCGEEMTKLAVYYRQHQEESAESCSRIYYGRPFVGT